MDDEGARAVLAEEVAAHRLDRRAVDRVLAAMGMRRARPPLPDGLSPREAEILAHAARGASNKEIGAALGVSPVTVKNHLHRAYEKTGVTTRAAARHELIED
jgi:DNA-binding CsgD family transcriptional regulator